MEKNVFILSDFVGFGNVAMATARTVLTRLGCRVYCLPTALISNTWNFGSAVQLDTTDYLRACLETWGNLGFRPDAVLLGYIADERQAEYLAKRCDAWHREGIPVYLDPIFADNGKLYRGITEERLTFLRRLLRRIDCVLPNVTESCFLAEQDNADDAIRALSAMTDGTVLITGVPDAEGCAVLLREGDEIIRLPYTPIPGNYPGAGDAFTALYLGGVLRGKTPRQSARAAMETVSSWIGKSIDSGWDGIGLPVERYF